MTVRDLIKRLLDADPEAEVCFALHNSDPIAVEAVEETTEEQVVLTNS